MQVRWSKRSREIKFREERRVARYYVEKIIPVRWSERAREIKFREARRAAKLRRNIL